MVVYSCRCSYLRQLDLCVVNRVLIGYSWIVGVTICDIGGRWKFKLLQVD